MNRLLTFFLLAGLAHAQPDPNELMRRAIDADLRNDEKTPQYTYLEQLTARAFDKDGNIAGASTWQWDVVPLKKYDDVDRKLIASSGRRVNMNLDYQLSVGPGMIPALFDIRVLREESLRGRNSWVIAATANTKIKPKDNNERELLNYSFTIWIDQEDGFPAQAKMEVVTGKSRLEKGSFWEWFYDRNADGVWLKQESRFRFVKKDARYPSRGEISEKYSNYRKFDVNSRIIGLEP